MHSSLLILALFAALALANNAQPPGAVIKGPFSLDAEPLSGLPIAVHWHPQANQATFLLSYPEGKGENGTAEFAHIWSLDEDLVFVYYSGYGRTFCHKYRVEGEIPRRFWRGDQIIRRGKCNGTPVAWYEGKWNELFVPYGLRRVSMGFDETTSLPVCAEIETFAHKKGESSSDSDAKGKAKTLRFPVNFDASVPEENDLFPKRIMKVCKHGHVTADEQGQMPAPLSDLLTSWWERAQELLED